MLRTQKLVMDHDAVIKWKTRIFNYQQKVTQTKPPAQTSLFDITPTYYDSDVIDPFNLKLNNLEFWRMPADSPGQACLYFVIDNTLPLLLYVGETCKSNQRWKGVHDCKQYVEKYHNLHYKYGLERAVNIAFWFDAPVDRTARLNLESELIFKWRPPFNKQCWKYWGQPFGKT